ncbi:MAG: hypothetical protein K0U39_07045 [Alphaproteobacteria bacterium]|nr:hypothetical protein [Alphaproteobacteria bacterium]
MMDFLYCLLHIFFNFLSWLWAWLFTDNFYAFVSSFATLGILIVSIFALNAWAKQKKFEYASKLLYLVNELYYKTVCEDEVAKIRLTELQEYVENVRLLSNEVYDDTIAYINIVEKIVDFKKPLDKSALKDAKEKILNSINSLVKL